MARTERFIIAIDVAFRAIEFHAAPTMASPCLAWRILNLRLFVVFRCRLR